MPLMTWLSVNGSEAVYIFQVYESNNAYGRYLGFVLLLFVVVFIKKKNHHFFSEVIYGVLGTTTKSPRLFKPQTKCGTLPCPFSLVLLPFLQSTFIFKMLIQILGGITEQDCFILS